MLLILFAAGVAAGAAAYIVHLVLILGFLRHSLNEGGEKQVDAAARAVRQAGLVFPVLVSSRPRRRR